MKTRSAFLWIAVIAASFFMLGMLVGRFQAAGQSGVEAAFLEDLSGDLALSDSQKAAVAGFLAEEDRAIQEVLEAHREAISAGIEAVRDATAEKIRGVLDDRQRERFDAAGFLKNESAAGE